MSSTNASCEFREELAGLIGGSAGSRLLLLDLRPADAYEKANPGATTSTVRRQSQRQRPRPLKASCG